MFLQRLNDICRTTSFRLSMSFLALFGLASLVLFGFMYLETKNFMQNKVDEWVQSEVQEFAQRPIDDIVFRLGGRTARGADVERPIALFDKAGVRVAGSDILLPSTAPDGDSLFDFKIQGSPGHTHFRGVVHHLASGHRLLIAQDIGELREFDEVLSGAMLLAGTIIAAIGLAGAAIVGTGVVGQINGITRAARDIMAGDLSKRLPAQGNSGDVARLANVVNEMLAEIERLMHEVKGVCDNIAHDLRTPLTRLLAGLERVQRRASSMDDYRRGVDEAIGETQAALRTFSALLKISEIEDGVRRSGFRPVDLVAVTADALDFYEPAAEEKSIDISFSVEGSPDATIPGEPSLLFEAIGNLVDNAIKFTPEGGRVSVRILDGPEGIGVAVSDTGPGIPERESEAIVRRFYRTERSRQAPGNGLGLSLVAAVARLHGMVVVIDQPTMGASVSLRYPIASGASKY
ncbi:sensor histidine kinase [Rhizobium mayense]|uniref:histidine kinase n=1 Tax=Rhizobium mayense TaxID=1312184 RepID=A0ABT7JPA0_9HYPH|nr:HAMP domain-containing sensor histidine kinase [Rhizobium mayense]MDL2398170.1 HAMP domain-containing sensor histidine kinase [Rhizobium mayense]